MTHNNWEYTKQCIDSIKKNTHTPYKILVIDNASTDGTIEKLRKDRTIYHIENSCNLGFSKGFNLGLILVDTPYFVLANNDIVVADNWLSRMIYHINTDKNLVVLGPRSNYVSGPQMVKSVPYNSTKSFEAFAKTVSISNIDPVTYFPRIVFFLTLFKKEVLEKVGFLDEIFGQGNFEDDDYCLRVARAKLKTAYTNTTFIHHYGSQSFKKDPQAFAKILNTNKELFMRKWKFDSIEDYYKQLSK